MFHALPYYATAAGGSTYADIPAVTDPSFSTRNGHFIFTEDYCIQDVYLQGPSVTAAQIFDPTYNAINVPQLYPPNLGIAVPSNPQVIDFRKLPPQIPQNEEIAIQMSNGSGTVDPEFCVLFISPNG